MRASIASGTGWSSNRVFVLSQFFLFVCAAKKKKRKMNSTRSRWIKFNRNFFVVKINQQQIIRRKKKKKRYREDEIRKYSEEVDYFFKFGKDSVYRDHFRPGLRACFTHNVLFLLCFFFFPLKPGLLQRAISRLFKHKFTSLTWYCCIVASEHEEFINM